MRFKKKKSLLLTHLLSDQIQFDRSLACHDAQAIEVRNLRGVGGVEGGNGKFPIQVSPRSAVKVRPADNQQLEAIHLVFREASLRKLKYFRQQSSSAQAFQVHIKPFFQEIAD
jgi:hypothetical protein